MNKCEEMLIRQCSPTLAGIKTGNLFAYSFSDKGELAAELRKLNQKLGPKGLRTVPVRFGRSYALIYFYRPGRLEADLCDAAARKLLKSRGYRPESPASCVGTLIKKLKENRGFPHEIGLFLGYPPEDVIGFIENRAENYKITGYWKVYGDAGSAEKIFESYKKCSQIYYKKWRGGETVEKLAAVQSDHG